MKWYPWLNVPYQQILMRFQQLRGHHALLLQSYMGNGEASLCYALSRWLMCQQTYGVKSCGVCHSCRLMIAGNHPDFYCLELEKGHQSLGVDNIREITINIYTRARHGGVKIVLLPHTELLTEQATHALLKTLEEPPEDTYFILVCQTRACLLPTLRSRCFYWSLTVPDETLSLRWLQQSGHHDLLSVTTALRLCANAPLAAEELLQPACWRKRFMLCQTLYEAHSSGDFLALVPMLNQHEGYQPIYWLLSLLTDALKWQYNAREFLVNIDRMTLIATLATRWSASILHLQWQQWLHCLRQWQEISGINHELLLTNYLLNWEQSIVNTRSSF